MNSISAALRWMLSQFLDAVLYFRLWQHRSEYSINQENRSALDSLQYSSVETEIMERGKVIAYLRVKLRRFPFWAQGHLTLAEYALVQRDLELAYSSSLAVSQLDKRGSLHDRAQLILARCMLGVGDNEGALKTLLSLEKSRFVNRTEVCEEMGAAYLALSRREEAKQILMQIPENVRSMSCMSALEYLNRPQEN